MLLWLKKDELHVFHINKIMILLLLSMRRTLTFIYICMPYHSRVMLIRTSLVLCKITDSRKQKFKQNYEYFLKILGVFFNN